MKIFLLTVLSFQLCLATAARRDCNEIKLKADQCVRHAILIGREEFEIPRTVPELDKMVCSSVNADLRCVGSIKQCLKPFQRTIVNLALKSVRKTIEESVCGK
ncbi:hypothetical protein HDE_03150 [Halotydeus destructor]|nr:hypothetical protein HDE_03150 [Halotydeus destructor]